MYQSSSSFTPSAFPARSTNDNCQFRSLHIACDQSIRSCPAITVAGSRDHGDHDLGEVAMTMPMLMSSDCAQLSQCDSYLVSPSKLGQFYSIFSGYISCVVHASCSDKWQQSTQIHLPSACAAIFLGHCCTQQHQCKAPYCVTRTTAAC